MQILSMFSKEKLKLKIFYIYQSIYWFNVQVDILTKILGRMTRS